MLNRRSAVAMTALFVTLLFHPFAVCAQEPPALTEVLEVSLTNVDVVASDKDGNPVAGLKPADFEIYENGKLQAITNFAEVGGSGAAAVLLPEGAPPAPVATPAPQFA